MAHLTLHKHDGKTDHTGVVATIRDAADMNVKDVRKIIENVTKGARVTLNIPLAKIETMKKYLTNKGFTVS